MFWLFRKNFCLYFLTILTHELHSYIRIWRSCIEFCEDVVYLGGLSHFLDHFLHFQHCWQMHLVLDCHFFQYLFDFQFFCMSHIHCCHLLPILLPLFHYLKYSLLLYHCHLQYHQNLNILFLCEPYLGHIYCLYWLVWHRVAGDFCCVASIRWERWHL